jgi:hypothetical protein
MIHFFISPLKKVYAVQALTEIALEDVKKLNWLFGESKK